MKKMQFNRDVEHIKVLIANYDNSTLDDKIVILDDLDYYLHQFDNANDFIFLEGLPKVVIPGKIKPISLSLSHPCLSLLFTHYSLSGIVIFKWDKRKAVPKTQILKFRT